MQLSDDDRDLLSGSHGDGVALAMRLVTRLANAMDAPRLRSISGAHIDSCLYHGRSGLDFVEALTVGGAAVSVPTTLNVASLDLIHPNLYRGSAEAGSAARELMDAYVALGCQPTWTCAPYQRRERPAFGEHVAWAESNAIVFANSVLGARTHRYGDFIDIAAALTGRVPDAGLHRSSGRRATMVFDASGISADLLDSDVAYPLLGFVVGRACGKQVPVIVGLPPSTSEDRLKAFGAAAASAGSVAMFHAVGVTPEAPTLGAACGGTIPADRNVVTARDLRLARDALSATIETPLSTISLGTPHYSLAEIDTLQRALAGRTTHPDIAVYVSTGREILREAEAQGWVGELEAAGVTFVTDTCTYITPIIRDRSGLAMTDSAKWAYYAPGNLGVDVVFASLRECVESAVAGVVVHDEELWRDAG